MTDQSSPLGCCGYADGVDNIGGQLVRDCAAAVKTKSCCAVRNDQIEFTAYCKYLGTILNILELERVIQCSF